MQNKKLIRFVQSLILLPITTMSTVPIGPIAQATVNVVSSSEVTLVEKWSIGDIFPNTRGDEEAKALEAMTKKAKAIDEYFENRSMPLAGHGMKMVLESEKNELDWRLVAAIAVRESTGGKFACRKATHNPFGWGSCKINFKSTEEAIETIARNLGGNNPKTAYHYDDKTTKEILRAYNPPSIVPKYAEQVMSIMNVIGEPEVETVALAK